MIETNRHDIDFQQQEEPPASLDSNQSYKEEQKLAMEPLRFEDAFESPEEINFKRRRRRCCCFSCLGFLLVLVIIIVVLALTVFRTKDPKISLNSVTVHGVSVDFDAAAMKLHVNLTLVADMSIRNPNRLASFRHGDSTVVIFYRGATVGQAVIPAGNIKADKAVRMHVAVTVDVDAFVSQGSNLIIDGIHGTLPMSTRTVISGRVNWLHIIKRHVTVHVDCIIYMNVGSTTVGMPYCEFS